MHKFFRYPSYSEALKCSPTKFFGTVRQKSSTGSSDILFLCLKFCDTWIFLKSWRASPRYTCALWANKNWTENRDSPLPLLSINFLIPEIFWNTDGFLHESFRHCETKLFQWRDVILLPVTPPVITIKKFYQWIFSETLKCSPTIFSALWYNKLSTEDHDTTSLPSIKVFGTWKFLKQKNVPYKNFRHCQTKQIQRKIVIYPSHA